MSNQGFQSPFEKLLKKKQTQNKTNNPIKTITDSTSSLFNNQNNQTNREEEQERELIQIKPEVYKRLKPKEYLNEYLKTNQVRINREDDDLNSIRSIKISTDVINNSDGSCLISIGKTSIICSIKLEITEPDILEPDQGFIVPNIELGSICCSKFKLGSINEESQVLSNKLRQVLISSNFLPLNSIVIEPGKFVWLIYIDLICLSNDGNLFDSSLLSIIHALKNVRIPEVVYDEDSNSIKLMDTNKLNMIPLNITTTLKPMSFSVFQNEWILPDPDLLEEEESDGSITIVLDSKDELKYVWFSNNIKINGIDPLKTIENCIALTKAHYKKNNHLI